MPVLINCKDLILEFPSKRVFDAVTLGVDSGDRIGIVGRNGDGKSSLLGLLAGLVPPDSGEVTRRGGITVGLLGQSDALDDQLTVAQAVVGERPEFEWASDRSTREIIDALLADLPWDARIGRLSGGQRRRVDLAALLIQRHDVLMLDEPTNHLDLRGITWLAGHLRNRWPANDGALLVVTHDRWFLDEVCNTMWEVHNRSVEPFEGGYSAYILQRVRREDAARLAEQKRQNSLRRELAWLARGAQARATKPKFHVQAARELIADVPPPRNQLELKRAAISRLGKQVVDLIDVTVSYEDTTARAADAVQDVEGVQHSGRAAAGGAGGATTQAADDATQAAGTGSDTTARSASSTAGHGSAEVITSLSWIIGPGDRIGILGENGSGKSTLLRLIGGGQRPSQGRVKIGASVRFGKLSQRLDELAPFEDDRVRELLAQCKSSYVIDGKELTPAKLLQRLGFERDHLQARICDLSGGQRRRLQLLVTLLAEPNVLVLDEPGNDLDTEMLALVEDLLDTWPGTLVLVSHDRYLIERVTDNQYALIGGRLRHLPGGVDEYLRLTSQAVAAHQAQAGANAAASGAAARATGAARAAVATVAEPGTAGPRPTQSSSTATGPRQAQAPNSHQLRKQLASIERKLRTMEQKSQGLSEQMHSIELSDYQALIDLGSKQQALRQQIAALEEEWLSLSEQLPPSN